MGEQVLECGMSELRVEAIIPPMLLSMEEKLARKRQAAALPWVSQAVRGLSLCLGTHSLCQCWQAHEPGLGILRCTEEACPRKKLEGD